MLWNFELKVSSFLFDFVPYCVNVLVMDGREDFGSVYFWRKNTYNMYTYTLAVVSQLYKDKNTHRWSGSEEQDRYR